MGNSSLARLVHGHCKNLIDLRLTSQILKLQYQNELNYCMQNFMVDNSLLLLTLKHFLFPSPQEYLIRTIEIARKYQTENTQHIALGI